MPDCGMLLRVQTRGHGKVRRGLRDGAPLYRIPPAIAGVSGLSVRGKVKREKHAATIMKFTHLIEINMPGNPLVMMITREQLWRGLVLRTEQPTLFVMALDACEITARATDTISRTLRFGGLHVHDQVTFTPQQVVHYHVPQQESIPASDLTMTIEEPQPGALFVRFEYDDHNEALETEEESFYNGFRREAYKEADIDTIRVIRELAQQGRLDAPIQ
jgi:hypothetical protein